MPIIWLPSGASFFAPTLHTEHIPPRAVKLKMVEKKLYENDTNWRTHEPACTKIKLIQMVRRSFPIPYYYHDSNVKGEVIRRCFQFFSSLFLFCSQISHYRLLFALKKFNYFKDGNVNRCFYLTIRRIYYTSICTKVGIWKKSHTWTLLESSYCVWLLNIIALKV